MSNALKIARRLKLPKELLRRARHYLKRRQRRAPEMVLLQKKREEAEQAREGAMAAQAEAHKQKAEFERSKADLERQATAEAALRDFRRALKAGEVVKISRFDKPGKIVRVDHKKNVAAVSLGLGQWEVPLDEVFPIPVPL
jgi:DNA mismatch repair protein MutS2